MVISAEGWKWEERVIQSPHPGPTQAKGMQTRCSSVGEKGTALTGWFK